MTDADIDVSDAVRRHYEAGVGDQDALVAKVARLVDGIGTGHVSVAQLAGLDQFHAGGLAATAELARRAGVRSGMAVLDAGSGLGGPSRYLAETFGCRVAGIDLAPSYVAIAELLTDRAGLAGQVGYRVGDLTQMPFGAAEFDLVWTQHVVMNIRDRDSLYREVRRVLKAGGRFAFYDALAADDRRAPHYPVPWAATPEASTLLTVDETVSALRAAGLEPVAMGDVTQQARDWMTSQQPPVLPGATLGLVVGPRMAEMVANFGRNLGEGRVRLVMGVFEAP